MTNIQFALKTMASSQDEFLISIHMIIFYNLVCRWIFVPAKTVMKLSQGEISRRLKHLNTMSTLTKGRDEFHPEGNSSQDEKLLVKTPLNEKSNTDFWQKLQKHMQFLKCFYTLYIDNNLGYFSGIKFYRDKISLILTFLHGFSFADGSFQNIL